MPSVIDTTVGNNYLKNVKANGLGPRTLVVKFTKTNITNDELNAWVNYLTTSHGSGGGGDSAFVVAGLSGDQTVNGKTLQFVSGTSDFVILALQGTGEFTDATVEALTGTPTVDILATFDQNYGA